MHLVYWYGADLNSGYGWFEDKVWSKKFLSFEVGIEKGYLDVPKAIITRLDKKVKLMKAQQERLDAINQIKSDQLLPKEKRIAWLTGTIPGLSSDEKTETSKINQASHAPNTTTVNDEPKKKKKKKEKKLDNSANKGHEHARDEDSENITELPACETSNGELLDAETDFKKQPKKVKKHKSGSTTETQKNKPRPKKRKQVEIKDGVDDEAIHKSGKPKSKKNGKKKRMKVEESDTMKVEESDTKKVEESDIMKVEESDTIVVDKEENLVEITEAEEADDVPDTCDAEQERLVKDENTLLPIMVKLTEAYNEQDVNLINQHLSDIEGICRNVTCAFVQHYQLGILIGKLRKFYKNENKDVCNKCKHLTSILKESYALNQTRVPESFSPKFSKPIPDMPAPSKKPSMAYEDQEIKSESINGIANHRTTSVPEKEKIHDSKKEKIRESKQEKISETKKEDISESRPDSNLSVDKIAVPKKRKSTVSVCGGTPVTNVKVELKPSVTKSEFADHNGNCSAKEKLNTTATTVKKRHSFFKNLIFKPKPTTPVVIKSTENGISSSSVVASLRTRSTPEWVLSTTIENSDKYDEKRKFALEFLKEAAFCFPEINRHAFVMNVEAAIYKLFKGNPASYWEKVMDIVAAIKGKNEAGKIVHAIMEGHYQESRDLANETKKKLYLSFANSSSSM